MRALFMINYVSDVQEEFEGKVNGHEVNGHVS